MNVSPAQPRRNVIPWTIPLILALTLLFVYGTFRSASLDDFDAYSFVLALEHFDLALQQPQPPGFPVYIFLGRCLNALVHNPTAALTWMSALSGALTALAVFGIGATLAAHRAARGYTGLLAALLVALTPLGWLTSGKALSDSLGMATTLLALWLLLTTQDRPPRLALAGLVTGLALGVRPQNALPLILWAVGYVIYVIAARRPLKPLLFACGGTLVGVMLWLLPTAQASGGLSTYIEYIQAHADHVREADSLVSLGLGPGAALWARVRAFGDTFLTSTIGVGLFAPRDVMDWVRVLIAAAFVMTGVARAGWRRRETWGVGLWASATTMQVLLLENLDRPRLMLPVLPPLALLVALGWARVRRPRWLLTLVLAGSSLALLVQGAPLAAQLATQPAPPAQAAAYVTEHYPSELTLVAAAGSFRAVQAELPQYRTVYLYRFDPQMVADARATGLRYVVIFDRDQFTAEALDSLSNGGRFVALEERTFVRDRRVHTQHDQVRVQVLTPADMIPPEALALPENGCLDIGGGDDGRYLGTGWFRPEEIGGTMGRWAGQMEAAGEPFTAGVRLVLPPASSYRVTLHVLAYPAGQTLALQSGAHVTEALPVSQSWSDVAFTLPGAAITPDEVSTLLLVHARVRSPFEDNGTPDTRALSASYDYICIEPQP